MCFSCAVKNNEKNCLISTHRKLDKNIASEKFHKNLSGSANLSGGCGIRETEPMIVFKSPKLPALARVPTGKHTGHTTPKSHYAGPAMGSTSGMKASHRPAQDWSLSGTTVVSRSAVTRGDEQKLRLLSAAGCVRL